MESPHPGSLASIFNAHHPYPAPKLSSPDLLESNSNSDQMINCIVEYPKVPIDELQCLVDTSYASLNNPQPPPSHNEVERGSIHYEGFDNLSNIIQEDEHSSLDEELNIFINLPPSKVRRTRHHHIGTAMDPQSIAARRRRERFSARIRILQSLVPNAGKLDTVSMLGQTLEYVRFLQHQVWQLYHGVDPELVLRSDTICEKWKDFINTDQQTSMK